MVLRRNLLLGTVSAALSLGIPTGFTLRLHRSPRREPNLTSEHLQKLAVLGLRRPRVLFVGNSMVLKHQVPRLVANIAAKEGIEIGFASAAAYGARLVETYRIPELKRLLRPEDWDSVVLQDFTKTPLRGLDRLGSAYAIDQLAQGFEPGRIVLYPPVPAIDQSSVYEDAGPFTRTPLNPGEFGELTMLHYSNIAKNNGYRVSPVPVQWLVSSTPEFYSIDGHHPNEAGAQFIACILWQTIREALR